MTKSKTYKKGAEAFIKIYEYGDSVISSTLKDLDIVDGNIVYKVKILGKFKVENTVKEVN